MFNTCVDYLESNNQHYVDIITIFIPKNTKQNKKKLIFILKLDI